MSELRRNHQNRNRPTRERRAAIEQTFGFPTNQGSPRVLTLVREKLGWSMSDASAWAGMSEQAWARMEAGLTAVPGELLSRLCKEHNIKDLARARIFDDLGAVQRKQVKEKKLPEDGLYSLDDNGNIVACKAARLVCKRADLVSGDENIVTIASLKPMAQLPIDASPEVADAYNESLRETLVKAVTPLCSEPITAVRVNYTHDYEI